MGALIRVSVPVCAFLLGCTSTVQVGLANAPSLTNGGTPETRVHDVIANGHDACERNAFPQGEVLRGQVPPCNPTERAPGVPAFVPTPAGSSAWLPTTYPTSMCPNPGPGLSTERRMAGLRLSPQSELACNAPW
jgi:hypothetical protein